MKMHLLLFLMAVMFAITSCQTKTDSGDNGDQKDPDSAGYSLPQHCNDDQRYEKGTPGGGFSIDKGRAMVAIDKYRTDNPEITTGFHISKQALDSLFSADPRANGIWIDLIRTKDIPDYDRDDRTAVVITARWNPHFMINMDAGRGVFISEQGCPNMCDR